MELIERIKEDIVCGAVSRGEVFSERLLQEQYNAGRNRTAFENVVQRLIDASLLERVKYSHKSNVGLRVPTAIGDPNAHVSLCASLITLASAVAFSAAQCGHVTESRKANDRMMRLADLTIDKEPKKTQIVQFFDLDVAFFASLAHESQLDELTFAVRHVRTKFLLTIPAQFFYRRWKFMSQEQSSILEAIKATNVPSAVMRVHQHIVADIETWFPHILPEIGATPLDMLTDAIKSVRNNFPSEPVVKQARFLEDR